VPRQSPAMAAIRDEDLERWIAAFRGPLIGLLASWGADWRAAEELAQDAFAEAWVVRERFVGEPEDTSAVGAWLRGIAWNLHCAANRAGERRAGSLDPETSAPEIEADERRALLAAAFVELDAPHQAILRMHYLEETGTREVAALLGLTLKAVEGRLYQARKALREIVERRARPSAQGARP
jgi:RNA polymerase sigma-70 factor, ECF subfamily